MTKENLFDLPAKGQEPDTSAMAALKLIPKLKGYRLRVFQCIEGVAPYGVTSEEISNITGINYRTVQPRTSELKSWGLIEDSGFRRQNMYGNEEIVWRIRDVTSQIARSDEDLEPSERDESV